MAQKVKIDGLADAVMEALNEYNDFAFEELFEIGKSVAKEGVKKLKATSPKGSGSRKGHYADGWSVRSEMPKASKSSNLIYDRKKPGLTHLLEKGHSLRQGGKARAIPHIKPIEEWCNEEFERRVKERLGQ